MRYWLFGFVAWAGICWRMSFLCSPCLLANKILVFAANLVRYQRYQDWPWPDLHISASFNSSQTELLLVVTVNLEFFSFESGRGGFFSIAQFPLQFARRGSCRRAAARLQAAPRRRTAKRPRIRSGTSTSPSLAATFPAFRATWGKCRFLLSRLSLHLMGSPEIVWYGSTATESDYFYCWYIYSRVIIGTMP